MNIDALLKNADWPKRTPDKWADLVQKFDESKHPRDTTGKFVGSGILPNLKVNVGEDTLISDVGHITLRRPKSGKGFMIVGHVEVWDQYRRQGWGPRLYAEAAAYAQSQGYEGVAQSQVVSPDAAALWQRMADMRGFRVEERPLRGGGGRTTQVLFPPKVRNPVQKFDPAQPRDAEGQWTETGKSPLTQNEQTFIKQWIDTAYITDEQREQMAALVRETRRGGRLESLRPDNGTVLYRAQHSDEGEVHTGAVSFSTDPKYVKGMFGSTVYTIKVSPDMRALDFSKAGIKGVEWENEVVVSVSRLGRHRARRIRDDDEDEDDYAEKGEHSYGNTQIPIAPTSSAAASLNIARNSIRDEHLMGTGKDVDPNHVTVRYGLLNDNLNALRSFIARQHPFDAEIGAIEFFPPSEHSEGAVPIVARIVSPELEAIEAEIGKHAAFKDKNFPDYKPHCTLAYCKPDDAPYYVDLFVHGSFLVQSITISHASGVMETIPFGMANKWDASRHPRDDQGQFTEVLSSVERVASSEAFKAWFGNSQVVDKSGKPQVMWRGDLPADDQREKGGWLREDVTREQIRHPEAFTLSEQRPAIYLSEEEDTAYYFATGVSEKNYPRPFFVKAEKIATPKILRELPGYTGDPHRRTASSLTSADVALLKKHGYDAIRGPMDWPGGGRNELAVFSPTQIKSIENVTFDPKDVRIMKRGWSETQHPRQPAGSSRGGEFMETLHGARDAMQSLLNKEKDVSIDRNDVRAFLQISSEQFEDPDLTDLHVEGMEIFGGNGLGIERDDMPQIPPEHRAKFLKYAEEAGVVITEEKIDPLTLKPTQNHISARRVGLKLAKYEKGKRKFPSVLVSEQNRILDGHHHWGMMAAFALEFPDAKMPIFRMKVSTKEALSLMHAYMKIHGLHRANIAGEKIAREARKADPATGRYVTPFVSFDKHGDDQIRMIASLNSSRLATWGFTAEAEVLGMARYRITAVLDGRTSEFCRMIDGKIFQVEDAREKVIEVLNVQDPEDLRVVQPWPKQNKASMAEYRKMDADALTERGLHIPPYHPYCRTLLRHVPSSEGELQEKVPTIPVESEVFQAVTEADLLELGVDASPENVAQWNAHIGMSPVELLSKLSGVPPREVLTKGQGIGANPVQFDESGNIGFRARGETPAGVEFKLGAILDPFTSTFYLTQAELLKGNPKAELGFLKNLFTELINTGMKTSATSVAVGVAGNASYLAKIGFLPDDLEWESIRMSALGEVETGLLKPVLESLLPSDQLLVKHLLQDASPSALSALVELPFTYAGKTIGEWVLESIGGTWGLDLTDAALVSQAKAYLS